MEMTKSQITKRRAEIEAELRQLDAEMERLNSLTPSQEMAEALHEAWCRLNHTDGCGWGYEGTNWSGHAHASWHSKAQRILMEFPGISTQRALEIGRLFR